MMAAPQMATAWKEGHQAHQVHRGRASAPGESPAPHPGADPVPRTMNLARTLKLFIERKLAELAQHRTGTRWRRPTATSAQRKRISGHSHARARGARQRRRVGRPARRAAPAVSSDSDGGSRKYIRGAGIKASSSILTACSLGGRHA